MKPWITYAVISMLFAGLTSVIAKMGMSNISGELSLAVRTVFVAIFVFAFAACVVPAGQVASLGRTNVLWLGISGVTTAVSWIFYYKSIKVGQVSTVVLIDKCSVIVAVALAAVVLKEQITFRTVAGASLMMAGLFVLSRK